LFSLFRFVPELVVEDVGELMRKDGNGRMAGLEASDPTCASHAYLSAATLIVDALLNPTSTFSRPPLSLGVA
jgi:hypothetical protein